MAENQELGEVMSIDTFKSLYQTSNVDMQRYWREDPATGNIMSVPLQDTAIYNGNVVTQYLHRTTQNIASIFTPIPGGAIAQVGAQIRDKGITAGVVEKGIAATFPGIAATLHAIDAEDVVGRVIGERLYGSYEEYQQRTELLGEKITNFGLHLADRGKELVAEMKRKYPTNDPIVGFLGDATGSILSTLGLMALGGEVLTLGVFGASSALDVGTEALKAGHSADTSFAASILVGSGVSALEKIGLNSIFAKTASSGVRGVLRHITHSFAAEGITEALQEVVELGGSYAVGGNAREITLGEALSQMIYAGAVGAFSGGVMVGGVTLTQRNKAINTMQQTLGVDRGTASKVEQQAEQVAIEEIFSKVGEDTGYNAIQNRKYQHLRDIASLAQGEGGISNEVALKIFESLKIKTVGERLLDEIRAQASADVDEELKAGEIRGKAVKGAKKVNKATEAADALAVRETPTPEAFEPISPEVINNVKPIFREAFVGRVRQLSKEAKQIKKDLMSALRKQAKIGSDVNTQTIQKLMKSYIDTTSEITYLKENPGDIVFTGNNEISLPNAEVLGKIADKQTALILRNVRRNFKLGRKASKQEFEYIKAVVKQLLNRPGISNTKKFEELGRLLNKLKTPEQLQNQFLEIESRVDDIITDTLIPIYKTSINNAKKIMKGEYHGTNRKVHLPARAQRLADIFLRAFREPDLDPSAEVDKIHTPEGYMRTLAARFSTETNPDGSELTLRDYISIDNTLRRFISEGSLAVATDRAIKQKTKEKTQDQVLSELQKTKNLAVTPAQEFWESTMSKISRIFNYDALISSLAKGMGIEIGSSAFETVMNVDKAHMKYETYKTYFLSQFYDKAKQIFGLKTMRDVSIKFLRDNVDNNQIVVMKTKADETIDVFYSSTLAQAREKYMLWLSPEGNSIMKEQGWNDNTIADLTAQFTPEDISFIGMQLDLYNEMYSVVNEAFRKDKGYDLSYRERYSPIYRMGLDFENTNMIDQLLGRASDFPSMKDPRFVKELTKSEKKLKPVADFQKLSFYINDASYYAGMNEKLTQIRGIIGSGAVQEKITEMRDKEFFNRLDKFVKVMERGRRYSEGANLSNAMNSWVTNTQKMLLTAKAVLFPKQLVSSLAALDIVSPTKYVQYLADLPRALRSGDLSELLEHSYFAHRSMNRAISRDIFDINQAFESKKYSKAFLKKGEVDITLNHYLFLATQLGDMGGTILNGWAVYNHYLDQGASKADATNRAIAHIDRTQQSARVTQQIGMALDPNPLVRAFTSFTHAPLQYASILVQQLDTIGTDRFNAKQFARTYAIFFTVLPVLYAAIGRGFDYREEDLPQYLAEFAIGPFDSLPVIGGLLQVAVARVTYQIYKNTVDEEAKLPFSAKWSSAATGLFDTMFKNIADVERILSKEYEDGFMLSDFLNVTTQLSEATAPIGGIYSGLARAVSNGAQGVALMSEENGNGTTVNSVRRALMMLGYSEYATRPKEE